MLKTKSIYFRLVKILIIIPFLLSNVNAQSKLTIFGGVNSSRIKYNNDIINNRINIGARNGFNIGFEYPINRFIAGASYLQRGSKLEDNTVVNIGGVNYEIEIGGYEVFNYASTHIYYPILLSSKIYSFIGLQLGVSLGGTSLTKLKFTDFNSSQSDELKLKPQEFDLDAGLNIGADYMINNRLGIRTAYYLGMIDVKKTLSDSLNYKNNTFNLSVLYKINGLKKKVNNEKLVRDTIPDSRLLLPENSVKLQLENRFGSTIGTQSKLTLGYGLKDFITIEISKSNYLKTFDFSFRTNYLSRLIKKPNYPISIIFQSLMSTHLDKSIIVDDYDKLSFLNQLIFEYKLGHNFRLMLAPTYLHKNIADTKLKPKGYPWDIWFVETGLHWFYKNNIQFYTRISKRITDEDISSAIKTGFKAGIQYHINSIGLDLSVTNLHRLHGTAIFEDIGINDNDQKLKVGFQINKMFN